MAYADPDMRLVGSIPPRTELELSSFYDDAADEIDAVIGQRYETPVVKATNGTDEIPRPVQLILKRINRALASGRYILSVSAGGEDTQLQAYGLSLVREAQTALQALATGEMDLDAKRIPDKSRVNRTPAVGNTDAHSQVDQFYENFTSRHDPQRLMRDARRFPYPSEFAEYERGL